ncbi:hypothetical protein APY04_0262 [Hyphomicrobium sulfonivorans]|uniref:Uncharacterized protein n=1 Tax=Hyphomicrobium sulfonivorans TaxID=121290 RepID=A0A109BNF1_HYPSL|nr:hypothetical protein APY04_0262 [Hyphomicrobium sulfonivorans]
MRLRRRAALDVPSPKMGAFPRSDNAAFIQSSRQIYSLAAFDADAKA